MSVDPGREFVDANVVVNALDSSAGAKAERARSLKNPFA